MIAHRFKALIASALVVTLVGCSPSATSGGAPSPTPSATPPPAATPSPALSTTTPATTTPATPTPAPPTTPAPAPAPDPLPKGPVNVLLIGTDSRTPGAMTGNADAIVVAQLSADRSRLALVSIARDTYVPVSGRGPSKINAAFSTGGTQRLKATVEQFLGIPIHATIQADFEAFKAVANELKGFTIQNRTASSVTFPSSGRTMTFPQGTLTLSGVDALVYARQRKGLPGGDLDRAERHRAVLIGMLAKLRQVARDDPAAFVRASGVMWTHLRVTGDLTRADVPGLLSLAASGRGASVTSLMVPISGFRRVGGADVDIVNQPRKAALAAALRAGDVRPYVAKYGTSHAPGR